MQAQVCVAHRGSEGPTLLVSKSDTPEAPSTLRSAHRGNGLVSPRGNSQPQGPESLIWLLALGYTPTKPLLGSWELGMGVEAVPGRHQSSTAVSWQVLLAGPGTL